MFTIVQHQEQTVWTCKKAPSRSSGARSGVSGSAITLAMVCATKFGVERPGELNQPHAAGELIDFARC